MEMKNICGKIPVELHEKLKLEAARSKVQKSSQSRQKTLYACLDRLPRWKMADYPLTVRQIRDIREK